MSNPNMESKVKELMELKRMKEELEAEIASMEELDIRATSGNVTAHLPAAPGFTARVETTSGDFSHTLPLASQGKTYLCGDGSAKVEIHTTSGSVKICGTEN